MVREIEKSSEEPGEKQVGKWEETKTIMHPGNQDKKMSRGRVSSLSNATEGKITQRVRHSHWVCNMEVNDALKSMAVVETKLQ